ncbi:MAG: toll/interleukin-1 receptor domain-containing protein [Candidatus Thiodiazotropha endolucinida]
MVTKKKKVEPYFQAANMDTLYPVLDSLAWLDLPSVKMISQFAGIDPRTAGKLLKNCVRIGVVQQPTDDSYVLALPYPYQGSQEQKEAVIKEAFVRMPLMRNIRQFIGLGDQLDDALRKAATVIGIEEFDKKSFDPLMKWAAKLDVLSADIMVNTLVNEAVERKEERHKSDPDEIVVFLSHSSKDKPFIRQLATDLKKNGVGVWLDEQNIAVGDSIVERVGQGLAESDYFILAMSNNSMNSPWVTKELNQALVSEIEQRDVKILPLKLSDCEIPALIKDKKYADFSSQYQSGLNSLLAAIKGKK